MTLLIILSILLLLSGCSRASDSGSDAIYVAGAVEVYADSILSDGHRLSLPQFSEDSGNPGLSGAWGVLDTLFNASVASTCVDSLSPLHIYMYGAMLSPEASERALRTRVAKGVIAEPRFPVEAVSPGWGAAAFEVYLWGRSERWLRDSYNITLATWRRWHRLDPIPAPVLLSAADPSLDGCYPAWMDTSDRMQTQSLRLNLLRQIDLAGSASMASLLSLYAERELQTEARELRDRINADFWNPQLGVYGGYRYGSLYKVLSSPADAEANALAILADIAVPEMSRYIISGIPMGQGGYTRFYPTVFSGESPSPQTTALMALAAARVRDAHVFTRALAALLPQVISKSRVVPSLLPAVVLRGLFGISATPDGVSFSPFVPASLPGDKTLSGLRVGRAVIDINLRGTGHRIASFTTDSVASQPIIPLGLTGHHTIDIVMANNDVSDEPAPSASAAQADAEVAPLPQSPVVALSANTLTVSSPVRDDSEFAVWTNGVLSHTFKGSRLSLGRMSADKVSVFDVAAISTSPAGYTSLPSKPIIHTPSGSVLQVPATSITPRRQPLNLIPDRQIANRFIELAPRHNTRLTFWVNAPASGTYALSLIGSNGFSEAAVRRVGRVEGDSHADSYLGTIISPSTGLGQWTATAPSTTLDITLRQGPNRLSLLYVQGTVLMNNIILYRK